MKHTLTVLTALLLASLAALQAADAPKQKPNLVIIFTDDLGYADIGAYGCKDIPTPHLDRLAAEGTRFTSAYTVAPICVPSRMGLMSGRFPAHFGVFDNVYTPKESQLWMQQTTLADVLKKQGYRTANIGKWHLSGANDFVFKPPHERGFDEFVGITGGMKSFWKGTELARLKDGKYERFKSPDDLTDFFGTEAVSFIERNKPNPFFLYLAFNAPHGPLDGLDEDQAAIEAGYISPDRRKYAAMIRAVDRNVGRVMDKLQELGLADNTLIVFTNDNGGGGNNSAMHTRNTAINAPYRGHKFDVWEGGVRVPFIMRWPGQVPAGKTFDGIVSTVDVFPTFAKVANASVPGNLDGVDLMPYLEGEKTGHPHETLCWQQRVWVRPNERKPHPAYPVPAYNLAIRSGTWKAIKLDQPFEGTDDSRALEQLVADYARFRAANYGTQDSRAQELLPNKVYPTQASVERMRPEDSRPWELYDLSRDPAELNDLATEFPEKVKELSAAFFAWQKQMPTPVTPPVATKTETKQN